MRATVHCDWPLRVTTEFPRPVVIHVDRRPAAPRLPGAFEVLYLCEPQPILPRLSAWARRHLDRFDLVVVSSDHLVGASPKVVPLRYGTTWVPPDAAPPAKSPGVSLVVGRKRRTEGHRLRHTVWRRQEEIVVPKRFFLSDRGWPRKLAWLAGVPGIDPLPANPWRWPALGDSKMPLFTTQFHLAIENCRSRHYFTEKLLDCLLTDTVPIYWGCLDIGSVFDPAGMLLADSADALVAAANEATPERYAAMAPAIAENRRRAREYVDLGSRLGELVAARIAPAG